ncbi:hypothetical protein BH09SUM1_BH09SUM1_15980 [soil metagenome]
MRRVQFICLANSMKLGARCIAGLNVDGSGWLRPVQTDTEFGQVEEKVCRLSHHGDAQLLDVIELGVGEPAPKAYQPENVALVKHGWRLVQRPCDKAMLKVIAPWIETGPALLGSIGETISPFEPLASSLTLCRIRDFKWQVRQREKSRQVRMAFNLAGAEYNLAMTDLDYGIKLRRLADGLHPKTACDSLTATEEVLLTISTSEPYAKTGLCYKLVAALIPASCFKA